MNEAAPASADWLDEARANRALRQLGPAPDDPAEEAAWCARAVDIALSHMRREGGPPPEFRDTLLWEIERQFAGSDPRAYERHVRHEFAQSSDASGRAA